MRRIDRSVGHWITRLLLLLALSFLCGYTVFAQRLDGTLRGQVLDQSGAAVANATVTATNIETNVTHTTTTSNVGVYTIPNLMVGEYAVTFTATGFQTQKRTNVRMLAAQVVEVSANMQVGGTNEVVIVQGGAELVQTESAQLTTNFSERMATEVPTAFGGNLSVQNLAMFAPNTTTQLGGTSGTGGSVGGLRGRQNNYTIDGTTNVQQQTSTSELEVIPDAVQEFSLSTNQFSAEYGAAAGGQFNVITKSGTNSMHGAAYMYSNNRNLNAADNLELLRGAGKDRYDYNRLGGNIGGAIIKNKLFYFGAYEWRGNGFKGSAPTAVLPTAEGYAALNGLAVNQPVKDLMALFPAAPTGTTTQQICRVANRATRLAAPATDPCANVAFGPVSATAPSFTDVHQFITNADYVVNNQHQLHFRHIKHRNRQPSLGALPQDIFSAFSATDTRKMIVSEVWAINNRLVNDFKSTFSRNVSDYPINNPVGASYPTIVFTGAATIGPSNNLPQSSTRNTYQLADNVSLLWGSHSLKWGGEYFWVTSPSVFLQNSRGQYAYANFQEFINDFIPSNTGNTLQGIGDGSFAANRHNVAFFLQDDWKVSRRLTLNLGLRYDFFGVPKGANRNALNAVSNCPDCVANPFTPLIWHEPKNDYNNFAPRIGVAYDPTGSGKWAIRGGFGMGYDHIPGNFYTNGAPPQLQAVLNAASACTSKLGSTFPVWCPSTSGTQFLGSGAMKTISFVPPSNTADARSLTGNLMSDSTSPQVYSWSISVQREVIRNTAVEVRYLGTKATGLPIQIQLNSVSAFSRGATALPTYFKTSDIPATLPASAPTLAQFNSFAMSTVANRPYYPNGFGSQPITAFPGVGSSRYHGLSFDISRNVTSGLSIRANYTFSDAEDNSTNDLFTSVVNPRRPQDFRNIDGEWGRSALDVVHKVAVTWVYDVPNMSVANPVLQKILHGWQYSGSYLFQGGQPVTILSGVDANGNGDAAPDRAILNPNGSGRTGSMVTAVCRDATTGATSVSASCSAANTVGYVANNPSAQFVQAAVGAQSNIERNTVNSGYFNLFNMAFAKNTKVTESVNIQFRADFFNAFNHRNYTLAGANIFGSNTNATSTQYSQMSAAGIAGGLFLNDGQFNGGSRSIHLGLRVVF